MENVTETEVVTTPVETSEADTSVDVAPADADTATQEPATEEVTAETDKETETSTERRYAGKYDNADDLEKAYVEAQKVISKRNEYEQKYNELLAEQKKAQEQKHLEELTKAQQRGFDSTEEAQIADKVTLAEFEYYWNNQNVVAPEYANDVSQALQQYYATGNKAYLEHAKTYFSSDFIEQVAVAKSNMTNNLRTQASQARQLEMDQAQAKLAETLKTDFAEFLGDIKENEGKSDALKSFCNANFIKSAEDMRTFEQIYAKIAKYEREQAIKELEAQKSINETKEKAVIPTTAGIDASDNNMPTRDDLVNNPSMYQKACKKWGMDTIDEIIMKG